MCCWGDQPDCIVPTNDAAPGATSSVATRTAIPAKFNHREESHANEKYFGQAVYRHGDHVYRPVWGRQLDWNLEAEYRKIQVHATSDKPTRSEERRVGK